jgi:hypothetical protein
MSQPQDDQDVSGKDQLQTARPDLRWFDARLDLVGKSRQQLSKQYDPAARNWLQKILTAERRCQIAEAIWLAEQLSVPLTEIVSRLGYKAPGASVRVTGRVGANSLIDPITAAAQFDVPAPALVREITVAAVAEPDNCPALVYAGALFFYTPATVVRPDAFGRLSVLECGDQFAPVLGTLGRGASLGKARITLLDGTHRDTSQLVAAYPVEWIKIT